MPPFSLVSVSPTQGRPAHVPQCGPRSDRPDACSPSRPRLLPSPDREETREGQERSPQKHPVPPLPGRGKEARPGRAGPESGLRRPALTGPVRSGQSPRRPGQGSLYFRRRGAGSGTSSSSLHSHNSSNDVTGGGGASSSSYQ
ncbi:uncharacterized protein LOC110217662 [Phascolarctos cinereus]